jgi:hypothetical protein
MQPADSEAGATAALPPPCSLYEHVMVEDYFYVQQGWGTNTDHR